MLSRNMGYLNKTQGYDRIFKEGNFHPISQFSWCHGQNCLLFFNLESMFHPQDNDVPLGWFIFKANVKNIETLLQLRSGHQMLLSLANNHTSNAGHQGVVTTKEVLAEHDIPSIGLWVNKEEAREIYSWTNNGIKLCFQTYSYDGNAGVTVQGGKISRNPMKTSDILEDLEAMKTMQCDAKIISLHRGAEYRFNPNNTQQILAHTLVDAGADLILGNHSHVPSNFETYKGKYIFYSFGNVIFDQEWGKRATERGFDYIYDYALKRNTVPTYISLLGGFKISKINQKTTISLDKIAMDTTLNGIHSPLDAETFSWYLGKIDKRNENEK